MSGYAVYLIGVGDEMRPCKIGISRNPDKRLAQIQTGCPWPLTLLFQIECSTHEAAYRLERELHDEFAAHSMSGEWFDLSAEDIVRGVHA